MRDGRAQPDRARRSSIIRRAVWALTLTLIWTGGGRGLPAQRATASALTAAFLYRFTAFTDWPSDAMPAQAPLVLCVVGDAEVAQGLEDSVKGHDVGGHPMVVRRLKSDGPLRSCHVLYAGVNDSRAAVGLLELLKDAPVLTVSYADRFEELGGIARLYVSDGRIKFAINLNTARRARLRLSPQMLSLATVVKDDSNAVPR